MPLAVARREDAGCQKGLRHSVTKIHSITVYTQYRISQGYFRKVTDVDSQIHPSSACICRTRWLRRSRVRCCAARSRRAARRLPGAAGVSAGENRHTPITSAGHSPSTGIRAGRFPHASGRRPAGQGTLTAAKQKTSGLNIIRNVLFSIH